MTYRGGSGVDRRYRFATAAAGSLFRCFLCNSNKITGGRRQVVVRGVKVWACADCVALKGLK